MSRVCTTRMDTTHIIIIKLGPDIESGLHSYLYLPFMYILSRVFTNVLCSWFGVFVLQSDGLIDLNSFLLITRRSADNLLVVKRLSVEIKVLKDFCYIGLERRDVLCSRHRLKKRIAAVDESSLIAQKNMKSTVESC